MIYPLYSVYLQSTKRKRYWSWKGIGPLYQRATILKVCYIQGLLVGLRFRIRDWTIGIATLQNNRLESLKVLYFYWQKCRYHVCCMVNSTVLGIGWYIWYRCKIFKACLSFRPIQQSWDLTTRCPFNSSLVQIITLKIGWWVDLMTRNRALRLSGTYFLQTRCILIYALDKQRNDNLRVLPTWCNNRNHLQNGYDYFKYILHVTFV